VEPAGLAAELAAVTGRTGLAAVVAGMSDVALLAPLAGSVDAAMYWQEPDAVDRALAHAEVAEALRPVAHAVTGASAARWWPSGAQLDILAAAGPPVRWVRDGWTPIDCRSG